MMMTVGDILRQFNAESSIALYMLNYPDIHKMYRVLRILRINTAASEMKTCELPDESVIGVRIFRVEKRGQNRYAVR